MLNHEPSRLETLLEGTSLIVSAQASPRAAVDALIYGIMKLQEKIKRGRAKTMTDLRLVELNSRDIVDIETTGVAG